VSTNNKNKSHDTNIESSSELVTSPLSITEVLEGAGARPLFPIERMCEYFGVINYATNERVLNTLKHLSRKFPTDSLYLLVTSAGGPSGTAMSFYDTVRYVLRPSLTTVGSGDVDSSALLVFLTGERRYITKHTTALLHRAGRVFDNNKRVTSAELAAMAQEDALKDEQYAAIVAERSHGFLTPKKVLSLMDANTTLAPQDFLAYGLADVILD
jgi:ATP-dependent protease ClpP protease subunit